MLAELVRVTRSGGRVAVVVRSMDMPVWANVPLRAELKAKVEAPGWLSGYVEKEGCADASLYRRLRQAGLEQVIMYPQLAIHDRGERLQYWQDRIIAALGPEEVSEWREAVAQAEAEGTFFIAQALHCAVGTRP
jgi:hypothetical protein